MLLQIDKITIIESDYILTIKPKLIQNGTYLRSCTVIALDATSGIHEVVVDSSLEEVSNILYNAGLL